VKSGYPELGILGLLKIPDQFAKSRIGDIVKMTCSMQFGYSLVQTGKKTLDLVFIFLKALAFAAF